LLTIGHKLIATAIAIAGFAFVLEASYPGYLNPDSIEYLEQALTGIYDDWQSPFSKLVWAALIEILPGPVGYIVLTNLLIWGSSLGLALALRPRFGSWTLLFLVIPVLPGIVNFLGNVHVDALLAAWLMAATVAAYLGNNLATKPRLQKTAQLMANALLVAAFLTRLNAIFAIVPLLLYANLSLGTRRNLTLCAVMFVAMPFLYKMQNTLIEARPMSPSDSIKVYNLLALSHYSGENLLPGKWAPEQERKIIQACYTPLQWDTAWQGRCSFIYQTLVEQQLWGSMELTSHWINEILRNPAMYFSVLNAIYKRSLYMPNSPNMLYHTPNRWNWEVATTPPRAATRLAQTYIRSSTTTQMSRPFIFALLAAASIVLGFRKRLMASQEGKLALALLCSSLIYLLTYFPFNVSAEYRYFYWSGFAAWLGTLLIGLAWLKNSSPVSVEPASRMYRGGRIMILGLAASAAALAVFPFRAPVERITVKVSPLEDKPVILRGLHNVATPKWRLWNPFEGKIHAPGWAAPDRTTYRSSRPYAPLLAQLETLPQDIEILLDTGPGHGKALIESKRFSAVVDTQEAAAGRKVVVLPAPPPRPDKVSRLAVRNLVSAGLVFVLLLVLFVKLAEPQTGRLTPRPGT
jgi:hypothetical protein